uniref:Uncharacterized protein n=1 Tax=viral metagenome TaxID=1070528 RepID=A0A6C0CT91_9ZZZZ
MDIFIVKEELINNLCLGITSNIVDGFSSMMEDARKIAPSGRVKDQMKRFLIDIRDWTPDMIQRETYRIVKLFPSLRKVLKTINFINIKSLSLMGRHVVVIDDQYIATKTPSISSFIHNVYKYSAREFFHDETLFVDDMPGIRHRQSTIITSVIKQILNECVPIEDMLHTVVDDEEANFTEHTLILETEQIRNYLPINGSYQNENTVNENDETNVGFSTLAFDTLKDTYESEMIEIDTGINGTKPNVDVNKIEMKEDDDTDDDVKDDDDDDDEKDDDDDDFEDDDDVSEEGSMIEDSPCSSVKEEPKPTLVKPSPLPINEFSDISDMDDLDETALYKKYNNKMQPPPAKSSGMGTKTSKVVLSRKKPIMRSNTKK